jgi:hypothetical protein
MEITLLRLVFTLIGMTIYFVILYLVVRAAMVSALRAAGPNVSQTNHLLTTQADLTSRLAKHLIAQSDLMLITAKNDGVTEEQLAPVVKQLEERKAADSSFSLPFK